METKPTTNKSTTYRIVAAIFVTVVVIGLYCLMNNGDDTSAPGEAPSSLQE